MLRPPPGSTLFPYTTLFRSGVDHLGLHRAGGQGPVADDLPVLGGLADVRSEEHTSELQSLRHLVCRLLLEKKKKAANNAASLTPSSRVSMTWRRHARVSRAI